MPAPTLEIIAPDLIGQLAQAWPAGQPLARALARSDRVDDGFDSYGAAVMKLCGLAPRADASAPAATLTAAFDLERPVRPGVLRADPVFLRADVSRVVLFDVAEHHLEADEARALLDLLNASFADRELVFACGQAHRRWYLEGAPAAQVNTRSPADLHGQTLEPTLAAMRGMGELKQIMTECQMLLHECGVNEARAAAGKPPINSIWLWGGEAPGTAGVPAVDAVLSTDSLVHACAAGCGLPCSDDLGQLDAWIGRATDRLAVVCAAGSIELADFSVRVFEPARAALAARRLEHLFVNTRDGRFRLARGHAWRWWRHPRAVIEAASAPHAAPAA